MLRVFDCTFDFLIGLFVFLMADINAFIESPSYTLLGKCTKKQLLRIAAHYEIDVVDKKLKESIKAELTLKLCERDILSMEVDKDLIVSAQMQTDLTSVLTFEQQKVLLLLQMEHERLKQHSEYDRMELEKAKIEVEVLKLRLMREGKDVTSGREDRVTFALNSNLKLVPKFNEEDSDIFFTLFERIAELQDWSE